MGPECHIEDMKKTKLVFQKSQNRKHPEGTADAIPSASESTSDQPAKGLAVISEAVPNLPTRPGVYRMLNEKGDALAPGLIPRTVTAESDHAMGRRRADRGSDIGDPTWTPAPLRR